MATDPQVYQAYSQALATSQDAPTTVLKDFLDSLISILWDMLRQSHSGSWSEHPLKVLYERLRSTRGIVDKCEDEKMVSRIGVLTSDAGVFVYSQHQTDPARLSDLLQRFDILRAQVELEIYPSREIEELSFGGFTNIKISDAGDGKDFDSPTSIWSHQPPQSSITPPVGFHLDEVTSILDRLTRGSKQLRIIQISGMPGIGKTTFALLLFNHPSVMQYFWARAWCPISQALDKKKVLIQLLNQIHESENYSKMNEEDLANKLRKSLKGKRYLILLDDVWTSPVWNSLEASFPNDSTGSRIILTSRNLDIATRAPLDEQPYLLRLREDSECLRILETKLIHKQGWNFDIGMKTVEKCKGLPLTLCIVAGVLAATEQEDWMGILAQLSSGGISGVESALQLSYDQLPDYLRPCLLYFGAFPEKVDFLVKKLLLLWMAEGFVRENGLRVEDVARDYLEELIERSLAMVVVKRSTGGVRICRIHDTVHQFCLRKAKEEGFFHVLVQRHYEDSDFNEPCNLQRLVIQSSGFHLKESRLFWPCTQSLLFHTGCTFLYDMSFIIQIFQLLKVLDMSMVYLKNGIPNEIDRLTRLNFLSIWSEVPVIPSSVGNLYNLETFIAIFHIPAPPSFRQSLWNLIKLKNLRIYCAGMNGCTLPAENLENSSSLLELEILRGVMFFCDDGSMEKQIRKFPNIRRLKCLILPRAHSREGFNKIVVPKFLNQLEYLTIIGRYDVKCELGSSPVSLRKLKMVGFELSKEEIAIIGKLPNLEVLKLHNIRFPLNTLDMEDEGFQKIRVFELDDHSSTLERWTASEDQLPCLVKMVFRNCKILKEIPCCLEISPTLEEIHAYGCSSTMESLVRDIEEVGTDFGNLIKVYVISA